MSSALETRVANYCRQEGLFRRHDRVIVGVSGGADSICLLRVLINMQESFQITLAAVHVNHGLRESAAEDAAYVKKTCEAWGIPYREYDVDVRKLAAEKKLSLEEAGRSLRYESFEDARRSCGANKIALAHHMDDQVETILWNLFRGTGARGLAGMAPRREDIVRPLLCVSKDEIIQFLTDQGISWRTDETNAQNTFTRNRLRNQLIPTIEEQYNRQGRQHIAGAGTIIAQMEDYIAKQGAKAVERCVKPVSKRSVMIRGKAYRKEEPILQEFVLREALGEVAGTRKDIGQVHVQMLMDLMENQVSREISLPYDIRAIKTYDGICIRCENKELPEGSSAVRMPAPEDLSGNFVFRIIELKSGKDWIKYTREKRYTKWFDYDIINNGLSARTRQPGDSIVIDDSGSRQKLKYYYINEKIPREIRDTVPLLAEDSDILWIVGYRISEKYKVTDGTKRVLQVTYRK